jgi:dienelactone hydrolase
VAVLHRLLLPVFAGWLACALPARAAPEPVTVALTMAERSVPVDVYRPAGTPRGAVVLSHGFTRSRSTLGGHAAALAEAGMVAVTPDLPFTFDFHANARGLADLVAWLRAGSAQAPAVERVVLVGFSAGGLSSLLAATTPGVVGYIGLDPFDRTLPDDGGALGRAAAPGVTTEALLLRAPPSRCNADAVAAPWATLLPMLVSDEVLAGASHCDFESPTDWVCRLACGAPDPARQQRVREVLLEAARRWLP